MLHVYDFFYVFNGSWLPSELHLEVCFKDSVEVYNLLIYFFILFVSLIALSLIKMSHFGKIKITITCEY